MLKLEKRRDVYHIVGTFAGKRVRETTRIPVSHPDGKKLAEQKRIEREQQILTRNFDGPTNKTIDNAIEDYRGFKKMEGRLSPDMDRKIDIISEYWKGTMLDDVTTQSVQTYVINTMGHLKPNSIRRYLNQLRAILNHASELYGWKCPKFMMPYVDDARDVHLDADQVNDVLMYFLRKEPNYYPQILLLVDTGARLSEMLRLEPTSFRAEVVKIRRTTSNKQKTITRDIPMTPDVTKLVEHAWPKRGLNRWNDSKSASATLNKAVKRACMHLNIPPIRIHDLRHTFAYLAAKNGADLGDLQYLLGHADISMTMRYRGFIQSRARSVVVSSRTPL
jgi:integrase